MLYYDMERNKPNNKVYVDAAVMGYPISNGEREKCIEETIKLRKQFPYIRKIVPQNHSNLYWLLLTD